MIEQKTNFFQILLIQMGEIIKIIEIILFGKDEELRVLRLLIDIGENAHIWASMRAGVY